MSIRLCLNPGHAPNGNPDPGACGLGLRESDVAASISKKVGNILSNVGIEIKSIQSDSLYEITDTANNWPADIFVSIHCNSFNSVANGAETLHYPGSTQSQALAKFVQTEMINALDLTDRGLKERDRLFVLNTTDMPAILIETAFIDNAHDNELLKNNQDDFANAIAKGIVKYINTNMGGNISLNTGGAPKPSTPPPQQQTQPAAASNTNQKVGIQPEDIAEYVAKVLIDSGVEGNFDDIVKSSKSEYVSIGISQWLYDRADNLLRKLPGGEKYIGMTYGQLIGTGLIYNLQDLLKSDAGKKAQLEQLGMDCYNYVNTLRQVWYLDDTRCLIYASTWATTSLRLVKEFVEQQRGIINIRSLKALAEAFANYYRAFFGVDAKYQLGYSNRAWRVYDIVAGLDLTTKFGIPEYGKGAFGK